MGYESSFRGKAVHFVSDLTTGLLNPISDEPSRPHVSWVFFFFFNPSSVLYVGFDCFGKLMRFVWKDGIFREIGRNPVRVCFVWNCLYEVFTTSCPCSALYVGFDCCGNLMIFFLKLQS